MFVMSVCGDVNTHVETTLNKEVVSTDELWTVLVTLGTIKLVDWTELL